MPDAHPAGKPASHSRSPTTNFLTAGTSIYAFGAGIAAAAGARLALQSIFRKENKFHSLSFFHFEVELLKSLNVYRKG